MIKVTEKNVYLPKYNNDVHIHIITPVNDDMVASLTEKDEDLINNIIINQIIFNLDKCIKAYEKSELPDRFINQQSFIITNSIPKDLFGCYMYNGDIYLNPDVLSGICFLSNKFIFGHEMAHKIEKYRNLEELYTVIRRIYDTNDETFLKEVFSDICGTLVSKKKEITRYPLNEEIYNNLKQKTLKCIYRG